MIVEQLPNQRNRTEMDRTMASSESSKTRTNHPGWLLVMPDGYVHSWYSFQAVVPRRRSTAAEAMRRFETNAARRKAKLLEGWTIQVGGPDAIGSIMQAERATA
ncbi:hypothetical protein [Mycobacteroides chelonae]|uniref:hypothetical protein n=1 Tax=Mycobacteroides chelonae TaxID=1774 RepID=UPI0009936CBF|nr:hypothetical protein [Mycobacteroides chelonae]